MRELEKFVEDGGVLITEGPTTQTFVEYRLAPGVTVEDTNGLYVPGSVIKTLLGDKTSPILYGYDQNALAVLIKNGPVLSVGRRWWIRRSAAAVAADAAAGCRPASAAASCSR